MFVNSCTPSSFELCQLKTVAVVRRKNILFGTRDPGAHQDQNLAATHKAQAGNQSRNKNKSFYW